MKKIIALLLTIGVLVTMCPMSLSAQESGSDLDFLKALGIVIDTEDVEYAEDEYITRIALAEIFYNIVFPTQNQQSDYWNDTDFPDVPAEKKHIASFAYGMGIMRGYSDNLFAPDDIVTYNQAIKTVVSFLGYDLVAQNLGGYPTGYLSQATRLKILPGTNISGDAKATYGGIAKILKKAVGTPIAVWNNASFDGSATLQVLDGVDYLQYYRGIKTAKGIVTGNYLTDIEGGNATSFFGIYIDGVAYSVSKGAHGIQDMLGYNVYVYYTEEGNYKTALYFEEGLNTVIEIQASDIESCQQGVIKYYIPGQDGLYSADFDTNAPLIYNGTYLSTYTVNDINPFPGSNYDGFVKLIDTNSDCVFDTLVVSAYETVIVNDVKNNKIYGMYNTTANIYDKVVDVSNYKERNINIRDITGALMEPGSLKKGDVLNVARDKNGTIKEIIASKDSMTGVIEEVIKDGGRVSAIKIAGTTFETANGVIIMDSENKLAPGLTADIYFACNAKIALIDVENNYTEGFKTGYLVDVGVEGTLQKSVVCMIFDSEGKMNTFTLPQRISVNGLPCDSSEFDAKLGYVGRRVKRQAILYKTDLDEKMITAVQIAPHIAEDKYAFNGFYQFPGDEASYSGGFGSFNGKYLMGDNIVVFAVPEESERDEYDGYKISKLEMNEDSAIGSTNMQLYGFSEDAMLVEIAVISNKIVTANGDKDKRPLFMVSKVATVLDEKGNTKMKISGVYVERVAVKTGSFLIDPQLLIDGHYTGSPTDVLNGKRPFIDQSETIPEPGDIFRTSIFGGTGEIDYMNVKEFFQVYDYGTKTFVSANGTYGDLIGGGGTYVMGKVDMRKGSAIKLLLPDASTRGYNLNAGAYKYVELNKNKQSGEVLVKVSTANAILAEQNHPGEGSTILLYYRGTGIACFIINE